MAKQSRVSQPFDNNDGKSCSSTSSKVNDNVATGDKRLEES